MATYTEKRFYYSTDVNLSIRVFISHMDVLEFDRLVEAAQPPLAPPGSVLRKEYRSEVDPEDCIVSVQVDNGGYGLVSTPATTQILPRKLAGRVCWEQWVTLPMRFADLSRRSKLILTLWVPGPRLLAGVTFSLFDDRMRLASGIRKLVWWPVRPSVEEAYVLDSKKPAAQSGHNHAELALEAAVGALWTEYASRVPALEDDSEYHAQHVLELRDSGQITRIPWLDRFTLPMLERMRLGNGLKADLSLLSQVDRTSEAPSAGGGGAAHRSEPASGAGTSTVPRPGESKETPSEPKSRLEREIEAMPPRPPFLHIELPRLPYPVVFHDAPARKLDGPGHGGVTTGVREFQVADVAEAVEVMADALLRDQSTPPALVPATHGVPRKQPRKPLRGLKKGAKGRRRAARSRKGVSESKSSAGPVDRAGEASSPSRPASEAKSKSGSESSGRAGDADPPAAKTAPTASELPGGDGDDSGGAEGQRRYPVMWRQRYDVIADPEAYGRTPVDSMEEILASALAREMPDVPDHPSPSQQRKIDSIIAAQGIVTTTRDATLLWRFRHSLVSNKRALVKFMECVRWNQPIDAERALSLLPSWTPIDVEEALPLLSHRFGDPTLRQFAVRALQKASDDTIQLYLLQLVQALRYEPSLRTLSGQNVAAGLAPDPVGSDKQRLVRTASNILATEGVVPGQTPAVPASGAGAAAPDAAASTAAAAAAAAAAERSGVPGGSGDGSMGGSVPLQQSPLARFLIDRACRSLTIATYLHWYVTVETSDLGSGQLFNDLLAALFAELQESAVGRETSDKLLKQAEVSQMILAAVRDCKQEGPKEEKKRKLNESLEPHGPYGSLSNIRDGVHLPLDPRVVLLGTEPGKCKVFSSAIYPVLVPMRVDQSRSVPNWHLGTTMQFKSEAKARAAAAAREVAGGAAGGGGGGQAGSSGPIVSRAGHHGTPVGPPATYDVIFKIGDDMRQDQLILQLVDLMNRHLISVGMDLGLTLYRVLATSLDTGMMECVPGSVPMDSIKSDILGHFRQFPENQDPSTPTGVKAEVMEKYVDSCAGYCVITYILMVGDRHFDNVLVRSTGHMFHIDFGYVFGAEPKPLQPKIKLTSQMIDGMGGPKSEYYEKFLRRCCDAYTIVRKKANLYLALLDLMRDANIENMGPDPDATLAKIRDNFAPQLDNEAAERAFLAALDTAVAALFPHFTDWIHTIATRMRQAGINVYRPRRRVNLVQP